MKPREEYRIIGAMFDVRPVDESGYVDVVKIKEINPVVDLSHLKKPKKLEPVESKTHDLKIRGFDTFK